MSKIGRKPIDITGVQVEIKGQEIHYKGPRSSGIHLLPEVLTAQVQDNTLILTAHKEGKIDRARELNSMWGLHRALLANEIAGARAEFEKKVEIIGLGYKAVKSGTKLVFSLGYSHKIDFAFPKDVAIDIDKTGQKLTLKSFDKQLLGQVCSTICSLRLPEPYKGTGIKLESEVIKRKAGKTK